MPSTGTPAGNSTETCRGQRSPSTPTCLLWSAVTVLCFRCLSCCTVVLDAAGPTAGVRKHEVLLILRHENSAIVMLLGKREVCCQWCYGKARAALCLDGLQHMSIFAWLILFQDTVETSFLGSTRGDPSALCRFYCAARQAKNATIKHRHLREVPTNVAEAAVWSVDFWLMRISVNLPLTSSSEFSPATRGGHSASPNPFYFICGQTKYRDHHINK